MRGQAADHNPAAFLLNLGQAGDGADIDEIRRLRQPQFHHRDKTVTAGEQLGIVAELREHRERILDGGGAVIFE
ncbi:MAG: hypothetical protein Q7S58_03545 [Candidatus Binatus sp.]|nr:hypothetical protein [Candidatus Binatus sp.]MDO8431464.1 hypothetical protein [Candidatus Binatus sp.]